MWTYLACNIAWWVWMEHVQEERMGQCEQEEIFNSVKGAWLYLRRPFLGWGPCIPASSPATMAAGVLLLLLLLPPAASTLQNDLLLLLLVHFNTICGCRRRSDPTSSARLPACLPAASAGRTPCPGWVGHRGCLLCWLAGELSRPGLGPCTGLCTNTLC